MFEFFKKYVSTSSDGKVRHLLVDRPAPIMVEKIKKYFKANEYDDIRVDNDFNEIYGFDENLTEVTITVISEGTKSKLAIQCYNDVSMFKSWKKLKFLLNELPKVAEER